MHVVVVESQRLPGHIRPLRGLVSTVRILACRVPWHGPLLISLCLAVMSLRQRLHQVSHSLSRSESSTVQRISCFEKYVSYPLDVRSSTAAGSKRPTNSPWM
jgi:hypothetical protein